jgi:Cu(I)/Ag(I) efflux system membrane protein CusA/SilA
MIKKLIRFSLENTFIVFLIALILLSWGWYAVTHIPVDAIPDIGENQAIVFTDWMGRDPKTVEDQVTYPLTISLQGVPGVKVIRSISGFGFSVIYVIFKDDIDFYWGRSRVIERLNVAQKWLPAGVTPMLGPDATALGQVFWYTVEGKGYNLAQLRSIQDWFIRYQLNSVEGVSEVASVGGYVKQYQIDVDPNKMLAYKVKFSDIYKAVRRSNIDVGAKVIENNGMEFIIRGVGFIKGIEDIENIPVKSVEGVPIFVKNIANVVLGADFRRGALDKEGAEAVGGVVIMRYGENPLRVIKAVKEKIRELQQGLPEGVSIVPFYDRTGLINETLDMLKKALSEEMIITVLVIMLFLLHFRASLIVSSTLPFAVLLSFLAMYYLKIDSNVMSLAGIAIAIGTLVDMGIIMTENIYSHLAAADKSRERLEVIYEAAVEVSGAILTAVSTTIIAFIPVFFMQSQEGKLFKPLAWTKTLALFSSVFIAITLVPVLCNVFLKDFDLKKKHSYIITIIFGAALFWWTSIVLANHFGVSAFLPLYGGALLFSILMSLVLYRMTREKLRPIEENAVSRFIMRTYEPAIRWVLSHKKTFLTIPALVVIFGFSIWLGFSSVFSPVKKAFNTVGLKIEKTAPWTYLTHKFPGIGREFMPALDEGSFLYMPSLLPSANLSEVLESMKKQDILMKQIPEVDMVTGKLGRAETSLDPAPLGMIETIITLKPKHLWRDVLVKRWYSDYGFLPEFVKSPLRFFFPEKRKMTKNEVLEELRAAADMPGVAPTWLQPIQTRIVMLQSGMKAMMGAKIFGSDLKTIEKIGLELEKIIKEVPGAVDVIADRIVGKPYIEYEIDRVAAARYGINVRDIQDIIETAIGGMNLTWTVEGRERYPVRLRYPRELRDNFEALAKIFIPTPTGVQIPIVQVADIKYTIGPGMIKSENSLLVGYTTFNTRDRDEVSVVEDAKALVAAKIKSGELTLKKGYYIRWAGQFENQVRANKRLSVLLPLCLFINFFILYLGFKKLPLALVIFFAIPVAMSGGFILLSLGGYNLSVAVWVGFIALFGIAVDDGVLIATYLKQLFERHKVNSIEDIREITVQAGKKRIRPALMTVTTTIIALTPILMSTGRGSDVMKPMALPSFGGMLFVLVTIFVVPCCYCLFKEIEFKYGKRRDTE